MGPADMDEPGPGEGDVPADDGHDDAGATAGDGGEVTGAAADSPAGEGSTPRSTTPESTVPESTTSESTTSESSVPDGADADETAALDGTASGEAPADQVPVPPAGRHRGRRKKILAWTAGGVAVVLLIAVGGAYVVYRHLNGN